MGETQAGPEDGEADGSKPTLQRWGGPEGRTAGEQWLRVSSTRFIVPSDFTLFDSKAKLLRILR